MTTTYHLEEKELNEEFISSVKKLFRNKKLTITIQEEIEETEYLLSTEANRNRLCEALEEYKAGKNIVTVDWDDLKSKTL